MRIHPNSQTTQRRRNSIVLSRRPVFRRSSDIANARGFTLLELLVVLAIIGLLAAVSLPAMKGLRQSNTMASAGRQLVDDFALARAKAISERTTVHVLFVPPDIMNWPFNTKDLGERLKSGQYTTYALYAERTVGDQPGRPQPRYLTSWRALPEGALIGPDKFVDNQTRWNNDPDILRPFEYASFPFPNLRGLSNSVPHVAFDSQGRLIIYRNNVRVIEDEVVPIVRGSLLYRRNPDGSLADIDIRQARDTDTLTNYYRVRIDGLTGRARVEAPPVQ